MKEPGWDDYAYFAAVARMGSLARAAAATGTSVATLSRRMRAFEVRLGRRLFRHGCDGYALTADGRTLVERTAPMQAAAEDIERWAPVLWDRPSCASRPEPGRRTTWPGTCGATGPPRRPGFPSSSAATSTWTSRGARSTWACATPGPTSPGSRGHRTGSVAFAAYGLSAAVEGWIAPSDGADATPSGRWIRDRHPGATTAKANDPHLMVELARAGVGRVVLPTFVGDGMAPLIRLSGPIEALASEQWLVAHHETRHDPPIRAAIDALAAWLGTRGARAAA